jgi:hypothetical protein
VLHRAATSISDSAAVRNTLISASFGPVSAAQQPDIRTTFEMAAAQTLRLESVSRGIKCYLSTGSADEAVRRMQVTARAQTLFQDLLRDLPFRPVQIASDVPATSNPSLLQPHPAAERPAFRVFPRSINAKLINSAFQRMRLQGRQRHPEDEKLWDILLAGVEPVHRIFRFRDISELELVATRVLDTLIAQGEKKDLDEGEVVLVVDAGTTTSLIDRDLGNYAPLKDFVVIRRDVAPVLAGYLPVAVSYRSSGGRDRFMSLLLLAIVWRLWRSLFRTTPSKEGNQDPGVTF